METPQQMAADSKYVLAAIGSLIENADELFPSEEPAPLPRVASPALQRLGTLKPQQFAAAAAAAAGGAVHSTPASPTAAAPVSPSAVAAAPVAASTPSPVSADVKVNGRGSDVAAHTLAEPEQRALNASVEAHRRFEVRISPFCSC